MDMEMTETAGETSPTAETAAGAPPPGPADEATAAVLPLVRHEDADSRVAIVQALKERRAGHYGRRSGPTDPAAEELPVLRAGCDVPRSLIAVAHRLLDSPLRERIAEAGITVRDLRRSCYFSLRLHTDYEREAALRAVEDGDAASVSGWFVSVVRRRVEDEAGKLDLMGEAETLTYEEQRAARSRLRSLGRPDPMERADPTPPPAPPTEPRSRPGIPASLPPQQDVAHVGTAADLVGMISGCDSIVIRGRVWRADDRAHGGRRLNLDALADAAPRSLADADIVPLLRPAAEGHADTAADQPPA